MNVFEVGLEGWYVKNCLDIKELNEYLSQKLKLFLLTTG